ncbi:MAG: sigma-54-dependent Fis family transcriptional regulator [Deltaproteobacteria bacterium]|nr:sigma-54-dependent Fis family transcriptional regulator [Deltaproteobacteria bacterium]
MGSARTTARSRRRVLDVSSHRTRPLSGSRTPARQRRVLVVDDAESIRSYVASVLELRGYLVDTAEDGRSALALLEAGAAPDAVLLDVMMPGMSGLETLARIREIYSGLPVVMLSVVARTTTIVEAMRLGAADYVNKPFDEAELDLVLRRVLDQRDLDEERNRLVREAGEESAVAWESESMQRVLHVLEQIADTDVTVLIHGESGVGKEVVARAVHEHSTRAKRPFVKVNCAALPSDLLESELFGYERGAFTGAVARKAGKFEVAHTGTIFLDEIGEMSAGLQAKLLQVLQDASFCRLGSNQEIRVDVRVVTATNRKLEQMVAQGGFREDLFFRLNVVSIEIPPLRERREEIPGLIDRFLRRYSAKYRKPLPVLSTRMLRQLERHPFPGNVRELENMMKRIVVLGREEPVLEELMARGERRPEEARGDLEALLTELERTAGALPLREVGQRAALEAEREAIERVLHRTHWNRKQAARVLGVSYKTLLQKIRECGLEQEI